MEHYKAGARPTRTAEPEYFTGAVLQDPIVTAPEPARLRALMVHFAPGARTYWHTHPLGQTIHIVSGVGRAQCAGGPVIELRPGDTVYFAPNERHWHGAAPNCAMSHLAMQEADESGVAVVWEPEAVSEEDYARAPD